MRPLVELRWDSIWFHPIGFVRIDPRCVEVNRVDLKISRNSSGISTLEFIFQSGSADWVQSKWNQLKRIDLGQVVTISFFFLVFSFSVSFFVCLLWKGVDFDRFFMNIWEEGGEGPGAVIAVTTSRDWYLDVSWCIPVLLRRSCVLLKSPLGLIDNPQRAPILTLVTTVNIASTINRVLPSCKVEVVEYYRHGWPRAFIHCVFKWLSRLNECSNSH